MLVFYGIASATRKEVKKRSKAPEVIVVPPPLKNESKSKKKALMKPVESAPTLKKHEPYAPVITRIPRQKLHRSYPTPTLNESTKSKYDSKTTETQPSYSSEVSPLGKKKRRKKMRKQ